MTHSAATPSPQADITGLTTVFPIPNTVKIKGEDFEVRAVKLGQIPAVLVAAQPLQHLLTSGVSLNFSQIFFTCLPDCYALISAMSGQSLQWVKDLDTDEGLSLFTKLLEVNLDFLLQRVLPLIPQLVGVIKGLREGVEKAVAQAPGQSAFKS